MFHRPNVTPLYDYIARTEDSSPKFATTEHCKSQIGTIHSTAENVIFIFWAQISTEMLQGLVSSQGLLKVFFL